MGESFYGLHTIMSTPKDVYDSSKPFEPSANAPQSTFKSLYGGLCCGSFSLALVGYFCKVVIMDYGSATTWSLAHTMCTGYSAKGMPDFIWPMCYGLAYGWFRISSVHDKVVEYFACVTLCLLTSLAFLTYRLLGWVLGTDTPLETSTRKCGDLCHKLCNKCSQTITWMKDKPKSTFFAVIAILTVWFGFWDRV